MIAPAVQHNALPGAQPRVNPPNPGNLELPANAAQCQMAVLADTHNHSTKECNTWVELSAKLKQQILGAVDKTHMGELSDRLTGHQCVENCSADQQGGE
jgi:hypothetical protein